MLLDVADRSLTYVQCYLCEDTCVMYMCFIHVLYRIDLWTMSITTLVVIFSAPMPKSPGGVVVRASD